MIEFRSISIILKVPFSHDTLLTILKRGDLFKFNYIARDNNHLKMTSNQATLALMHQIVKEKKDIGAQDVCIKDKEHLSSFAIYTIEHKAPQYNINAVDISIIPQGISVWHKDTDHLDFERYIRLLLDLCQDFEPLWLRTSEEYADMDFYYDNHDLECQFKAHADISLSPHFRVEITLFPDWQTQIFKDILEHGHTAGWKFYQSPDQLNATSSGLSANEAIEYILQQSPEGASQASLWCTVNETHYQLSFKTRPGKYFVLVLKPLSAVIDFSATVRHALDLCTDICILELNTFDERYNYYERRPHITIP